MFRISVLLFSLPLILAACSTSPTLSNEKYEETLSDTSRDILIKIIWNAQLGEVYETASEEFKQTTNPAFMRQRLNNIFEKAPQNRITIQGYERHDEAAVVHAFSESNAVKLHYRLAFIQQGQDFLLNKFSLNRSEIPRAETYSAFKDPVSVNYSLGSLTK